MLRDELDAELQQSDAPAEVIANARRLLGRLAASPPPCTCTHRGMHRGDGRGNWHCLACARCGRGGFPEHGHAHKPNPLDHDYQPCPCEGEN
jgi:hypothetical protein